MNDTLNDLNGMEILLVDDVPENLDVLRKMLGESGFTISVAPSGEIALNLVNQSKPDLILLDVMMLGIDGYEVCRRLKENDETRDIPVIFVTAKTETIDTVQGFLVGGVDYITKPFKFEEVLIRVKTQLKLSQTTMDLKRAIIALHDAMEDSAANKKTLAQTHSQLKMLLDSAGEGICGLDTNGDTTFVNPAAEKMLGYSKLELIGKPQHALIHHAYADGTPYPREQCHIYSAIKDGKIHQEFDEVFWRKDGTSFPVEYISRPILEEGEIKGAVITFSDISERKSIQAQLNQAQKMESIGQLAAGIAHEINTPLQFIGDNTYFLQNSFKALMNVQAKLKKVVEANEQGSVPAELFSDLEDAAKEADIDYLSEEVPLAISQSLDGMSRVSEIVKAMKSFSHPGSDEKILSNVNQAINTTLTVSRNEWKYVADVETDLDSGLPQVPLHPNEFNQVILNLVINAAHAIADVNKDQKSEKGKIFISTCKDGDYVEVRVRDTGGGVPEEIRTKIFDPFFTTKEVGKGTGQGLAITHSVIVDKHKGEIKLEVEEGKGSTFVIRLSLSDSLDNGTLP
jgi:two-component system, NtrC family, sensor kinase